MDREREEANWLPDFSIRFLSFHLFSSPVSSIRNISFKNSSEED